MPLLALVLAHLPAPLVGVGVAVTLIVFATTAVLRWSDRQMQASRRRAEALAAEVRRAPVDVMSERARDVQ